MPTNNGNYTLPPVYKAEPGTTIRSEQHNVPLEDLAVAMNGTIARDGTRPPTANLNMGGRKVTGLAPGTGISDAVRMDQLPAGITGWLLSVSNLALAANQIPYATGATSAAATNLTAFGRSVIGAANAASGRTAMGLGSLATVSPTGSATSANFLRGDGVWAAPPSVSPTDIQFSQLGSWFSTAGAVGTYMFATRTSGAGNVGFGSTLAGSSLSPVGAFRGYTSASADDTTQFATGSAQAGTWRCMGNYIHTATGGTSTAFGSTLWLRIS